MGLPVIPCPVCNSQLPLESWLTHAGARQALVALAELHGSMRLAAVALRYLALFAPEKRTLSLDRVGALLADLGELIRPARVEWQSRTWAVPIDTWIDGMEQMLADPGLRRPIKNHNYLRAVVAGMAAREEGQQEHQRITRGRGETPVGNSAAHRAKPEPVVTTPRASMPSYIKDQLSQFTKKGGH